jgi:hypothetical protein
MIKDIKAQIRATTTPARKTSHIKKKSYEKKKDFIYQTPKEKLVCYILNAIIN